MLTLTPAAPRGQTVVLGLAAHPDDLEIGAGGTLLQLDRLVGAGEAAVHVVVMTGTPERVAEGRAAAADVLGAALVGEVTALDLPDGLLPGHWLEAKTALRAAVDGVAPDWVLVPRQSDAHQDHRLLAELATQLFRGATIWEYEIPKWDGDLAQPNLYVPLSDETMDAKINLLLNHYASQRDKPWYDQEVFRGLCRLRGIECGARYAEAFTARKTIVR